MWSVFGALKTTVSYTFYASVKIGQFIVTALQLEWTNYLNFLHKLLTLVTVIIEDFAVFLRDVRNNLNNIITVLWTICERVTACVAAACQATILGLQVICEAVSAVYCACISGIIATLNAIKAIFVMLKHLLVMFGDGVWFIVVYIPKASILTCISALSYAKTESMKVVDNIYAYLKHASLTILKSITDCFHFLTDVPVESVMGIIFAMCLLYIFLQFYTVLYVYVCGKFFSFFHRMRHIYNHMKATARRAFTRRRREVPERMPMSQYQSPTRSKMNDDGNCIICQDHPKCVLVLPCRHLCLCIQCTPRLLRYTGRCPICRKRISSTMRIFT